MNYIVDPSWVYWVSVIGAAKVVSVVAAVLVIVAAVIIIPVSCAEARDKEDYKAIMKWAVPLVSVGVFFTLAAIFIPSEETLITMKVAELATKDNITLTAQQLKEIVDYIINAMKELK